MKEFILVRDSGKPVNVTAKMYADEMKFRCEVKECQMMFGPASRGMQNYMCNDMRCPCSGKYNCVHKALVRVELHGGKNAKECVDDSDDELISKQYVEPDNDVIHSKKHPSENITILTVSLPHCYWLCKLNLDGID
ncbi:hypothetical protein LSH36_623g01071 [Paralvinella palmiformis]|uniref:Uncharacterized protein n=1 Tax=Paralvinella palmiformis TaxID=53620 RepID=A0AAD9MUF9_9ANNE|nr:hypothetical protein LSH36_623g01071 [Paralvinella palmiformis]